MRYLIALAPLALLAACWGNKAANNSAKAAPANAAAPAATPPPVTMAPAGPAAVPSGPPVQVSRADMVAECATEVARELPAGADATALCGCAVDQVTAGVNEQEATRVCAAQLQITMAED